PGYRGEGQTPPATRDHTDPRVFRLETDGLLAETWQSGCHASELENTGNCATTECQVDEL
ncbi:MAG: hypothetical protein AAFZ14_11010, partial [Pseudomonadota bacterium]